MNRFSQLGQILERLGLTASSDFLDRGTVNSYSLTGPVGWFNFLISVVVLGLVAFKLTTFSKDRKRKYVAKTRKKIRF
jgi:hypothetical protein